MTSHIPDDGFHEIQLNGKQLVFLFMAATVVSVVIFLCGVLVGRGVRTERGAPESAAFGDVPIVDQTPIPTTGADPRIALPPPPVSDLPTTYTDRLEKPESVQEALKPVPPGPDTPQTARTAEPPPVAVTPPAKPPATAASVKPASIPPPTAAPARAASAPAGGKAGFAVQLAALNSRGEADAMVKRLSAKGYDAYVQDPAAGAKTFRVRVGNYPTRGEAETAAAKIEKEGQFKPWVAPR